MTNQKLIEKIEGLYPADSSYDDTAKIGREFLICAIEESGYDWRDLPKIVLEKYLELCEQKEKKETSFKYD